MQTILKMIALVAIFMGLTSSVLANHKDLTGTKDTIENLITAEARAAREQMRDQSVRDIPFTVEKKVEDPATSGLMTLHPRAIPFVKDYLEIHEERLIKMKSSALPYFAMIDKILVSQGLPRELKYLAVIESDLKSSAVSWAGAVGPWQFMPQTGQLMGLKVSKYRDERRDLSKSTYAAAKYLKYLHAQLKDWLLVIAAYNGGPSRVEAAIRKSGSRNFWDLQYHLPTESRNHVKKFIATHYIMEGQGGITTTSTRDAVRLGMLPPSQEVLDNTLLQTVTGKYNSKVIARAIEMDHVLFTQLNPGFDSKVSSDSYGMRLPEDKMKLFNEKKMEILDASVQLKLSGESETAINYPKEVKIPEKGRK
jgi:membrane-bound lytic murein transglycosylase D